MCAQNCVLFGLSEDLSEHQGNGRPVLTSAEAISTVNYPTGEGCPARSHMELLPPGQH